MAKPYQSLIASPLLSCCLLVMVAAMTHAQFASSVSASGCHLNAVRDAAAQGQCECTAGFVGDGTSTCGIAHAVSIALASDPMAPTSAVVALPLTAADDGSLVVSGVTITSVQGSAVSLSLFQTNGTSPGAALELSTGGPWNMSVASVFLELAAGSPPMTFAIEYTYLVTDRQQQQQQTQQVFDAVTVATYSACAGLDDLAASSFGYTTAPELGSVSLSWLSSRYQVEFDVTAAYEHDNAIVLLDTVEFDAFTGDVRSRPSGSCSAHPALPSTLPFNALFQAAPTATSAHALSGDYLAYPDLSPTGWSIEAVNCSAVAYRRAFALSELGACNNVQRSSTTDPITGAAMLTYAGSIFLHTLQPGDDAALDETQGFAKFTQTFPWQVKVYTEAEALVQLASNLPRIHVVVRDFEMDGGDMVLLIETRSEALGIDSPLVLLSDGSGNTTLIVPDTMFALSAPCLNNTELDMCVQQWSYRKNAWTPADNVIYNFVWAIVGSNGTDLLTVPISLNLRVNDVQIVVGRLGDLALSLYSQLADAQTPVTANAKSLAYPWHVNERIYVRGDVMLNPTDVEAFTLSYRDLWLCYTSTLNVAISLDTGGCLAASISDAERLQLLANGAIQASTATAPYNAAINELDNGASSVAAGFSFDAFPLTSQPQVYTIHAKVLVQSKTGGAKKRELDLLFVPREANAPSTTTRFMIFPATTDPINLNNNNNNNNNNPTATSNQWIMVVAGSGSAVGVSGVVVLVVVLALVVRRKRLSPSVLSTSSADAALPVLVSSAATLTTSTS